jgi:hypothetical protein
MSFAVEPTPKGMKKTYRGSCVCGAVRFACELDLSQGTIRCNCSFCRKARMWFAFAPGDSFRLLAGADVLTDYQRTPPGKTEPFLHLTFCSRCGVRPFSRGGFLPAFGAEFHAVNVACLDDATDEELAGAPVQHPDGRNDDWASEAPHRYL